MLLPLSSHLCLTSSSWQERPLRQPVRSVQQTYLQSLRCQLPKPGEARGHLVPILRVENLRRWTVWVRHRIGVRACLKTGAQKPRCRSSSLISQYEILEFYRLKARVWNCECKLRKAVMVYFPFAVIKKKILWYRQPKGERPVLFYSSFAQCIVVEQSRY